MTTANTEARVMKIVAETIDIKTLGITEIRPEHHLLDDLCGDSLDIVEIMIALEMEFDIAINDDDFLQIKTVQQVIDHIRALTGATA